MPRILIVDDDEYVRKLVRIVVESAGFNVAFAATMEEVENLLPEVDSNPSRAVEIHAAILDGQFPRHAGERPQDTAGAQTAEYLRRVRPGISIIALSGNGEDTLHWADVALRKPASTTDLKTALQKLPS